MIETEAHELALLAFVEVDIKSRARYWELFFISIVHELRKSEKNTYSNWLK